jgi:hypothetical protein
LFIIDALTISIWKNEVGGKYKGEIPNLSSLSVRDEIGLSLFGGRVL